MATHWSLGETRALLEAWAPLHQRCRQAQGDPWVPPQRRSSFNLVDEDWRAIAVAVNNDGRAPRGRRANRTAEHCKSRIKYLRTRYAVELSKKKPSTWKFFAVVDPVFAGEMPLKLKGKPSAAAAAAGEPSAAAKEERDNDGEAGGSRAACSTTRSTVEAVLMKISDLCERVMLKFLENEAAEKASRNAGTGSDSR